MDRYWKGFLPEPSVRTVGDMECVLADPDSVELDSATPLYYMYRDLAMNDTDREILSRQNIRYDMTVIPPISPNLLGGEYVKTKGHYHPDIPFGSGTNSDTTPGATSDTTSGTTSDTTSGTSSGIGYPELYQVLAGEARYLLQKKDLSDVVAVTASEGDCVFIPPGYGHITINASDEVLVMANLVSTRFESEYAEYEEMRGGAFYAVEEGGFVQNLRYSSDLNVREIAAGDAWCGLELGIGHGEGIYDLVSGSADLSFLNESEKIAVLHMNPVMVCH